jgi:hypothetical protein
MRELLRRVVQHIPGYQTVDRYLLYRYTNSYFPEPYPRGHYYSPLPDISEVQSRAAILFCKDIDLGPSIDLKPEMQQQLLTELAAYYGDFCWPEQPSNDFRFHLGQSVFCHGDAVILHAMLRHFAPKRIIEVGSGFSSALMLDVDARFLQGQTQLTFIEPYPEQLLSLFHNNDLEKCTVIGDKLQNVPLCTFHQLEANDILFVDSTHVSKIGSDVNRIVFDILPILRLGVLVHFHDILWPFEYLPQLIAEGKAWNEAYLLRAFLQYNSHFEIILFNSFVGHAFKELLESNMPMFLRKTGGSLWLRKIF